MRISDWSSDVCSSDLQSIDVAAKVTSDMGPPVVGDVPPSYARPPGSLLEKRDRLLILASWHYLADVRRRSWARRRGAACSRWSGSLPDPTCRRTSTTTGSCGEIGRAHV